MKGILKLSPGSRMTLVGSPNCRTMTCSRWSTVNMALDVMTPRTMTMMPMMARGNLLIYLFSRARFRNSGNGR